MAQSASGRREDELTRALSDALRSRGECVAVAESLTGGQLAATLSAAPEAAEWFRGGIVAYHPEVKYDLLGTLPGPVVTPETASAMALAVTRLLGADYGLGVTGVGGPRPDEGQPPGTVYLAVCSKGAAPVVARHQFSGEPIEVMQQTIVASLQSLILAVRTESGAT